MKPLSFLLLTMAAGGCLSAMPAEAQLYPASRRIDAPSISTK
jgi:hypothetical protein